MKKDQALKGGFYSLILSVLVLAILAVINVLVSMLPARYTRFDISSSKLYSVTSNTKAVVNNLTKDVTIYWIVQANQEDKVIENLLDNYDGLSDHISVVKRNPDVYPTFASQYTDEQVSNNSLVVECGSKNRYISYSDIYIVEPDMYSYTYNTSFDGEGAITSAIDYVVSDDLPQMYMLTGHGEADLPGTFADQITKANIELSDLSLLMVDEIPDDADCVMIYAPESDISANEAKMLSGYVTEGGKLIVISGPAEEGMLTNLNSILKDYGVEVEEGIVVEGDRMHYAFGYPYVLLPDMDYNVITEPLIDAGYLAIMPLANGLSMVSSVSDASVIEILTTSDEAFSKAAGYALDTYEFEEGDIEGPFAVGMDIETADGGKILWFASSYFLEDMYNAYSSGANVDLAMNSVSYLIGEREALSIRSKSLNYNYLTISSSTSSFLKVIMIGVFPLAFLGIGIIVVLLRRRKLE